MSDYVGARYTPKFIDDEWDPLVSYDNLVVVPYQGTSYISGKPVPAGTPLSNRNYWHIYGASSGAIINLQNQIDDMKDPDLSGSLQNQINDMKDGTVPGSLQNQINTNTSGISNLTTEINDIKSAGTTICVSDSYGDRANGWVEKYAGLNPSETIVKACASGFGFAISGGTFQSLITPGATPNSVPLSLDPSTVKKIVVAGGFNDAAPGISQDMVSNAISAFQIYAASQYPNAKIYIAFVGWSFNEYYLPKFNADKALIAYKDCARYGCIYLNGTEFIMHNRALFEKETPGSGITEAYSYVHPNTTGSMNIAVGITQAIKGGKCSVEYPYIVTNYIPETGLTITTTWTQQLIDNRCFFLCTGAQVGGTFNIVTGLNTIPLGTSDEASNSYSAVSGGIRSIPTSVLTSNMHIFPAKLKLQYNKLILEFYANGAETATQINIAPIENFVDIER